MDSGGSERLRRNRSTKAVVGCERSVSADCRARGGSGLEIEVAAQFNAGGRLKPVSIAGVQVQAASAGWFRSGRRHRRRITIEACSAIDVASDDARDESSQLCGGVACRVEAIHDLGSDVGRVTRQRGGGLGRSRLADAVGGSSIEGDGTSHVHGQEYTSESDGRLGPPRLSLTSVSTSRIQGGDGDFSRVPPWPNALASGLVVRVVRGINPGSTSTTCGAASTGNPPSHSIAAGISAAHQRFRPI